MDTKELLKGYDLENISIGVLGGHSALDVCHGAKKAGFKTVCVARKGREKTYDTYFKSKNGKGCIDETILVDEFEDILNEDVQKKLREMNTIFIHNRYFWVYFSDYAKFENEFKVPIFGNRSYVKIEERDQKYNQYHLLHDAGIRTPKIFEKPENIDRPVIVKANEKTRGYERAFFVVSSSEEYEQVGSRLEKEGKVDANWRDATIEEFVVGAHTNFNFFYSPLTDPGLELMGTDTRRQTNLDGFLRMPADQQEKAAKHVPLKMIETGHIAVTIKESLIEKAFALGEKFVSATKKMDSRGIVGPFALQGAVVAEEGKEDIVIFDVSMRIPGSPGTRSTPYSGYLHGEPMSYGERIAEEIKSGLELGKIEKLVS
jgi:5-formaminoimidazole-4-carboxamide-1-(beta)-D-ribofuranosyl 5'-monophosphate synthetase